MKKFFRFLIYALLSILFLVIVLLVIAKFSENKITKIALRKVSKSIEAPVEIKDVSFNLLRKFPLASIELHGVSLREKLDSARRYENDTLINLDRVFIAVKSRALMEGIIEVVKIDVHDGQINYKIDSAGNSNIDFLLLTDEVSDPDTIPGKPLHISLKELKLENIAIQFRDDTNRIAANIELPELELSGNLKGEELDGKARGNIKLSQLSLQDYPAHLMKEMKVDFDAAYSHDSLNIQSLLVNTDGAMLELNGHVNLGESIGMDLTMQRSEFFLEELKKYIPAKILYEIGLNELEGKAQIAGTVKGSYSGSEMPRVDVRVAYEEGRLGLRDYPDLSDIHFRLNLSNGILQNNKTTQLDFSQLSFTTANSNFDVALSLLDLDHPKYDIQTKLDVDLEELKPYIPDSLAEGISGRLKMSFATKGVMPDSIDESFADYLLSNSTASLHLSDVYLKKDSNLTVNHLNAEVNYKPGRMDIEKLNVQVPSYGVKLKNSSLNARFKGSVNDLSTLNLYLDRYYLNTGSSNIVGDLQLHHPESPEYALDCQLQLDLREIAAFLPDTLVTRMDGEIQAQVISAATLDLDSLEQQMMDLVFNKGSYQIEMDGISIEMAEYPDYHIDHLSGKLAMNKHGIRLDQFFGSAAGIDFAIDSTRIENLYSAVILNQAEKFKVDTRVSLGDLDYASLMALIPNDSSVVKNTENTANVVDPEPTNYTMEIKGVARVESFTYDSVFLNNISTLFNVQDSVYTADQLKFDAFDGHINTSAKYILKPDDRAIIQMRNNISRMDIKKLLQDFDDFEAFYEPSIRSENISGLLSCDFYTRLDMIGDSLVEDALRVRGEFELADGGVFDFEPATALSKKTNINELDNIQFKNLSSQVFILQRAIYVPKTYISSTALDITAYGMQSFGEDYEYHLKIHLSDILIGKSKKLLKEQEKMGDIASGDDRNKAVYMVSYSLDGNAKTGFDKKKLQSAMKTKIRLQETLLKLRFHPEMFKFDTGVYPNND